MLRVRKLTLFLCRKIAKLAVDLEAQIIDTTVKKCYK